MKIGRRIYYLFLPLLVIISGTTMHAQEIFQTKGGEVSINLGYVNHTILLQSKKLQVQLDYDNAVLTAILPLNTLINTADERQPLNINITTNEITLTGKFGVDHIETSNHEPLQFEFSGILTDNKQEIPVAGMAELQHIGGGGDISCLLGFTFNLDKSMLPDDFGDADGLREIKVQVLQTILKRRK